MPVTRASQVTPLPVDAPIAQGVGIIASGDALNGTKQAFAFLLDETNADRKVSPPDEATQQSVLATLVTSLAALNAVGASVARGAKTLTTPAVGNSAAVALAANTGRKEATLLSAPTNTQTVYIGPSGVTTSAYMQALGPGESWVDSASNDAWYAVVASASATLVVTEIA